MKQTCLIMAFVALGTFANAQLWRDQSNTVQPASHYANQNGTYPFQPNPNNNMGTSPNNAMYKNNAAFYNKDNYIQNNFPSSNGQHFLPGSQGNNGTNYLNNNTPGSNIYPDANGRSVPVYSNPAPVNNKMTPVRQPEP